MKKYLVIFLMISWTVSAQQIPLSTIFVENPFVFNPAVAGSDNFFKLRWNGRLQWVGFGQGPVTNTLSGYGPHAVRPMGYGGNLTMDQTGPVSMLKINGGFAYNIYIASDVRASLGLNLGMIQYRADGTQFVLYNPNPNGGNSPPPDDPAAPYTSMSNVKPDAGAGIFIYHTDWFLGLSAQQLFNNNIKFTDTSIDDPINRLKTHFFAFAGYRLYIVNQKYVVEPTVLGRMVPNVPFQLDFCARLIIDNKIWGGLSARNTFSSFDDISLIFGYIHERRLHFSISYDYSLAKIGKYTAGSIEFMLGINFNEVKKGRR